MRTSNHVYSVFDHKNNCTILVDATLDEISRKIGIERYKVHYYCDKGYKYHGRYSFISKAVEKPKKPEKPIYVDKFYSSNDKAFMKTFDNAMDTLRKNYSPEQLSRVHFVERQAG